MDITICVKGKKFDNDSSAAIAEYIKRMSVFCNVKVAFFKNYSDYPLQPGAHSVNYVIKAGKNSPSSPDLAAAINNLQTSGYSSINYFIIDQYDDASDLQVFDTVDTLSLSCFLMRTSTTTIVLTEQLYRAFTILNNITYHK